MKPLSNGKISQVQDLLRSQMSFRQIKDRTGVSLGSISSIRKALPDFATKKKEGRPCKLSERDVRKVCRVADQLRVDNAVQIAAVVQQSLGVKVSRMTIARTLKSAGYRSVKKSKKPLLTSSHRRRRLEFAKTYVNWTLDDWKRVIWSDETKVNRILSDGMQWSWVKPGRSPESKSTQATVKHGGGRIMVWACFTSLGPGYCTLIEGNMDQMLYKSILERDLEETAQFYALDKEDVIFQHDGDPKHTARSVKKWLEDNNWEVLPWPAQSPDLNPIENLWYQVKCALSRYPTQASSCAELWLRFQAEWEKVTVDQCLNLISSMPSRLQAVIDAKGGPTKY